MLNDLTILLDKTVSELKKEISSKKSNYRAQRAVLVISLVAVFSGIASSVIFDHNLSRKKDYQQQLDSLNEVEHNIRQLVTFIESQKSILTESQTIIDSLKKEESTLRPLVEADRQLADAILNAQQSRNRTHIWKERFISFFLGVIASIVAALLISAVNRARIVIKSENT